MNTEEFAQQIGCLNDREQVEPENVFEPTMSEVDALPASVNWVTAGAVTGVKN